MTPCPFFRPLIRPVSATPRSAVVSAALPHRAHPLPFHLTGDPRLREDTPELRRCS